MIFFIKRSRKEAIRLEAISEKLCVVDIRFKTPLLTLNLKPMHIVFLRLSVKRFTKEIINCFFHRTPCI